MKYIDYVLDNFFLIYDSPIPRSEIKINYGNVGLEGVCIPNLAGDFFASRTPLNLNQISWKIIKNESIPILFSGAEQNTIYVRDNYVNIYDDIIASSFYFLTGWQEYISTEKDDLGRFKYENSIQNLLKINHIPVVNYYFDILKNAIEVAYNIKLTNRLRRNSPFITCVTHDVDIWKNISRNELKYAVKKLDFGAIAIWFWKKKSAFDCFRKIEELQRRYSFKSTYFFLPSNLIYSGRENADYKLAEEPYKSIIHELSTKGNEIGLHGSFTSSFDSQIMDNDLHTLDLKNIGNRFHYLLFDHEKTPELLVKNQLLFDTTLGFGAMPGFRNGTSYPFFLFDFTKQNKATLEIPMIIMDASIFYKHYLNFNTSESAWELIHPVLIQIYEMGGCLTINWHNHVFSNAEFNEWQSLLIKILDFCTNKKSDFCTCKEVVELLNIRN